jgi:hypothetical protein
MGKSIKAALNKSLNSERAAVEERFSRAEALIGDERKPDVERSVRGTAGQGRPKVIRDSFTLPQDDYRLIAQLKGECLSMGVQVTKGELVRAGLKVLAAMRPEQLRKAVEAVERVKTGRPKELQ